jgi:hypothetical protein
VLGYEHRQAGIGHLMAVEPDLLKLEYQEVNAHLRANIGQFVNWFSFFLLFSFVSIAFFSGLAAYGPERHGFVLRRGVQIVFLLLHVLAFVGILIFRRYILAVHCRLEDIIQHLEGKVGSPIPVRFCKWMTDLMAAGFVVSYFLWFSLLLFW